MQADGAVPSLTITFLGFGKVAVVLAQRLVGNGASVRAYDIVLRREGGIDLLRSKAGSLPISFVDVPEAISGAALIMSVVPPAQAMTVAIKVRPYLRPDQIFVDAASVGPREKRAIAQAIAPTGSGFVDAAILEAVETAGADVRILVCGPDASTANEILRSRGLNTEVLGADIGAASTFKMLRSVLSKGLEALLLEVMMAARTAGLDAPLWTEFERLFAERGFRAVGGHLDSQSQHRIRTAILGDPSGPRNITGIGPRAAYDRCYA